MNTFEKSVVFSFKDSVAYAESGVVSRQVMKNEKGNVTLFAFSKGEGLSEHTAPFDALVQIVDGTAAIIIGGQRFTLTEGQSIIMPANIPHAVEAPERFKMVLTMIRP
ncbi:MAG: cupin domain-containing protein [Bacteroidales bacterium]|nr:cupin domain-containing protein [Bacteroidales bacterium]